jgi:hypothetical protein
MLGSSWVAAWLPASQEGLSSMSKWVILDLGTSWRREVSYTLRSLYLWRKTRRYPLDRRLGGPQDRSTRRGEQENLAPYGDSNFDPSAVQPVASRYTDSAIPAPVLHSLSTSPWRHMGEWRYSSSILDIATGWRRVASFTPRPLYLLRNMEGW